MKKIAKHVKMKSELERSWNRGVGGLGKGRGLSWEGLSFIECFAVLLRRKKLL